ncbi:TadA family conjugal transfer-associated ATPase [Paeniglutamicibacter antarcticus]|uniref:TadA family conjugal transfer-associated ATPase n=1 Tax=Arthrobacter terrae TaxID=2935737 RepID=A0A931G321_9MICC|nr:TadA family conjugal transfer-associated ATPase [Arthrobacter terrae]MBG0738161.1 TadA family conjugal transfer-associated ATPase [Arthrobacter terrae]
MIRRTARQGLRALDETLLDTVRRTVLSEAGPVTPLRVATAVRDSGRLLGTAGSLAAVESINAELSGLGPLQPLLKDLEVTDIFVNGPQSVWVDRGSGAELVDVFFTGENQLRALAVRLIAAGGRRLDDASPCVDVRLDGGYRVHAVLPPISAQGVILSIRIRRAEVFTLEELVTNGFAGPAIAAILRAVIAQRLSFLISGATGTGKTTLLSTLLSLCDAKERLVLIEDAAELEPDHPHVLTLEARHANAEGGGAVDLVELVRQALRMSPTRLIVGECRGAEVRELFSALNTGHRGGGGTIHANGATDVPARLAALGALAGLSAEAVAIQAVSALDVVVHLERGPSGRRVAEIGVVLLTEDGLEVAPALSFGNEPGPVAASGRRSAEHVDVPRSQNADRRLVYGAGWEQLLARLGGTIPGTGPASGTR